MSKTDKTNPWWVTAEWYVPVHDMRCVNHNHIRCVGHRRSEPLECDLPAEPVFEIPRRYTRRNRTDFSPRCVWEPDVPSYYSVAGARYWPRGRSVKRQANDMERSIRTAWRNARQEFLQALPCVEYQVGCRCNMEDIETPDPRHRHFAVWDRW